MEMADSLSAQGRTHVAFSSTYSFYPGCIFQAAIQPRQKLKQTATVCNFSLNLVIPQRLIAVNLVKRKIKDEVRIRVRVRVRVRVG